MLLFGCYLQRSITSSLILVSTCNKSTTASFRPHRRQPLLRGLGERQAGFDEAEQLVGLPDGAEEGDVQPVVAEVEPLLHAGMGGGEAHEGELPSGVGDEAPGSLAAGKRAVAATERERWGVG